MIECDGPMTALRLGLVLGGGGKDCELIILHLGNSPIDAKEPSLARRKVQPKRSFAQLGQKGGPVGEVS